MKRTRVLVGMCLVGLACIGALSLLPRGLATTGEVPSPISETLEELRGSSIGMAAWGDDNPAEMETQLAENQEAIDALLDWARSSDENAEALSADLLSRLAGFTARFGPDVAVPEEVFDSRPWVFGENPESGLAVWSYVLLAMAEEQGSPALAARVLAEIHGVHLAVSHFFESMTLYDRALTAEAVAREKRENGGYLSTTGAELAWCCEQYMVRAAADGAFAEYGEADAVLADYMEWRDATMAERYLSGWLPSHYQHRTTEYARALADALPVQW